MAPKELKIYSLHEMKNKYIGKIGIAIREEYECKLRIEIIELKKKVRARASARHPSPSPPSRKSEKEFSRPTKTNVWQDTPHHSPPSPP